MAKFCTSMTFASPGGSYSFLRNESKRQEFLVELNELVTAAPFTLIATVIRKNLLKGQYAAPANPYVISLELGLERVYKHLASVGQSERITHVVVEKRGPREDAELELEFRRICDGANFHHARFHMEIVMTSKLSNAAGLQIADLVARPIGIHELRPAQPNRSWEILQTKFRRSPDGQIQGWGLKTFP